jgi:hypothetical protein
MFALDGGTPANSESVFEGAVIAPIMSALSTVGWFGILGVLYFPLFESSRFQGTPGKLFFRLEGLLCDHLVGPHEFCPSSRSRSRRTGRDRRCGASTAHGNAGPHSNASGGTDPDQLLALVFRPGSPSAECKPHGDVPGAFRGPTGGIFLQPTMRRIEATFTNLERMPIEIRVYREDPPPQK